MKVNVKGIQLTKNQQELYDAVKSGKYKYILANYSRQQGKSTCLLLLCLEWLMMNNEDIIYFCPSYLLGRTFFAKLQKLVPEQLLRKCNASDLTLETITNSTIRFFSAEAAVNTRGNNCTRLCIDEAAFIPTYIDGQSFWYNIVSPMIKVRGKTCVMISTPLNREGFFYEMCMVALEGRKGYKYIKKDIYSDSLISKEEIEELKKGYPEIAWKCEFECEFLDNAISFFTNFDKCFKTQYEFDESSPTYIGIDPSGNGNDECILTKINDKMQVRQYKIIGDFDSKYNQISSIINTTTKLESALCETNGLGAPFFNEIYKKISRKPKLNEWNTTNSTKQKILSNLASLIQQNKIQFNSTDTELYKQLSTFICTATHNHNLKLEAKKGFKDDRVMSLAIALEAKNSSKQYSINNYGFSSSKKFNFY